VPIVDDALESLGRVIGKPPGWERLVRALAPPSRFIGGALRQKPMPDGYVFPIDRGTLIGWNVNFFGSYEPEVRVQIKRWLAPGATAVDVGANVGWHALLMATIVGHGGRVYAFEPNDSTRARLLAAIEANHLSQITVDSRALSDRVGIAGFQAPQAGDVWDGTGRLTDAPSDSSRTGPSVECVTLDGFVAERGIGRLDLVKIDVEGWELSVLRGARRTLETLGPAIVFEYDPAYVARCGGSGADLTACLEAADYLLFRLAPRHAPRAVPRLESDGGNFLAVPTHRAGAA
jgi:FkbM family methyltransferase